MPILKEGNNNLILGSGISCLVCGEHMRTLRVVYFWKTVYNYRRNQLFFLATSIENLMEDTSWPPIVNLEDGKKCGCNIYVMDKE